jgi:hypothetical protein
MIDPPEECAARPRSFRLWHRVCIRVPAIIVVQTRGWEFVDADQCVKTSANTQRPCDAFSGDPLIANPVFRRKATQCPRQDLSAGFGAAIHLSLAYWRVEQIGRPEPSVVHQVTRYPGRRARRRSVKEGGAGPPLRSPARPRHDRTTTWATPPVHEVLLCSIAGKTWSKCPLRPACYPLCHVGRGAFRGQAWDPRPVSGNVAIPCPCLYRRLAHKV